MNTYICFLRGINVSEKNLIKMLDPKLVLEKNNLKILKLIFNQEILFFNQINLQKN